MIQMKHLLFLIALLTCSAISFSQGTYPVTQNMGAPSTLVLAKGGLKADSSLIIPSFSDTSKANISAYLNKYAGSLIRVQDSLYMRSAALNKWINISAGGGGGGGSQNLQQVTDIGNATTNDIFVEFTPSWVISALLTDGTVAGNGIAIYQQGDTIGVQDVTTRIQLGGAYDTIRNKVLSLPVASGKTIAVSVNGNYADSAGNISVPTGGSVTAIFSGYGIAATSDPITTTGTIDIDTAELSTKYLRLNDTASMLAPYLNGADTVSLSNRINGKIDSLKRNPGTDSVFAYKNNQWVFQYRDSIGTGGGGGGGGKIYYFNGGVFLDTISGIPMYELGDTAVTGVAANFTRATTGNIANFITDSASPSLLQIPAGIWTVDAYLSETGGGANHAEIYASLEIWNGSTLAVVATSPIEEITNGSSIDLYTFGISVPTTALSLTDRIVIQFYIQNTNGKTVTLYTQNGYIGEVHSTFTTGIGALNGLTAPSQTFATGTTGTDFNISSATSTHTFNLPTASATNRGALSSSDWSTFNGKIGASDTSVFQRKNVASYSFRANNTNAAANATDQVFRDPGVQTYTSTIAWTGTTAPSGSTNHSYNWQRIGNMVTLNITLNYSVAGSALTAVTMALPADCPTPKEQSGLGAANEILYFGTGQVTTASTATNSNLVRAFLRVNAADNGYELGMSTSLGNYKNGNITIQYFAN
jgi:hypothetical protein